MGNIPTVVVAIPAFKAAATIGETLDALQKNDALDRVKFVVLLDDCSPDNTVAVARRHWLSSIPFHVWSNAENMGERRTTNAAIGRLANLCDWTFILHADDVVKPSWLTLNLAELNRAPSSVASICSSYDTWRAETGRIEPGEEFPDRAPVHIVGNHANVLGTLDKGCWWHLSGCGIKNRAFLAIGGFEPDMPQLGDWEWLLRCLLKGYDIWYLPRSTMLYRQHSKSVSAKSFREARDLKEKLRIFRLIRELGYLSEMEHKAKIRATGWQLMRRAIFRLLRGDAYGCYSHLLLLAQTSFGCADGRL